MDDLRWPLAGLALGLLTAGLLVAWSVRRPGARDPGALPVAHVDRLRAVPRFAQLVRQRVLLTGVRSAAALVLAAAAVLLVARPQTVVADDRASHTRDVMLCLDASSSMREVNQAVLEEFRGIVDELDGERVGLTLFSTASITVIPLSDDYGFVREELATAAEAFRTDDFDYVAGTYLDGDPRASQIGDGLVSCTRRFDRPGEDRGRAIVLASDNDPLGEPIFTLAEAADYAAERDVVVYGVGAPDLAEAPARRKQFVTAVERSGGTFGLVGDDTDAGDVAGQIDRLERVRAEVPPVRRRLDDTRVAAGAASLAMLVLLWSWVAERRAGRRRP